VFGVVIFLLGNKFDTLVYGGLGSPSGVLAKARDTWAKGIKSFGSDCRNFI
jgi:hypothetical protein